MNFVVHLRPIFRWNFGGLVRRGSSANKIYKLVKDFFKSLRSCSNDPVCSDHHPNIDEPNGAACHSCVLLPETSCELANHLLDRNWGLVK